MVKNAFPVSLLCELSTKSDQLTFPNFLKDLLRRGNVTDYRKLEEFLIVELQNAPLQSQETVDYYLFIGRQSLLYAFFRRDIEGFQQVMDLFKHRLGAIRGLDQIEVNFSAWEAYIQLLKAALERMIKQAPIEVFEAHVSALPWGDFDESFVPEISRLLAVTYLFEENDAQVSKARLWLHKSISEGSWDTNLINYLFQAHMVLAEKGAEITRQVEDLVDTLEEGSSEANSPLVQGLYRQFRDVVNAASLTAHLQNFDDQVVQLEQGHQRVKELETYVYKEADQMAGFFLSSLYQGISQQYISLFQITEDEVEKAAFVKEAEAYLTKASEIAEQSGDLAREMGLRHLRTQQNVAIGNGLPEKDAKEVVQYYKKSQDYQTYISAASAYINLLQQRDQGQKGYDQINDIFKLGHRKIEEGGFYLITRGFELCNKTFLIESRKPGVSWMVDKLEGVFEQIVQALDLIEEHHEAFGRDLIDRFRSAFINFEPISHFQIRVYLGYQYQEIKAMRIGALLNEDPLTLRLAENLLRSVESKNNPLNFMLAEWDDFKNVPNQVRNNTLNKCIDISKGDLPLAAQHLDFSYRNLRSYITFKEVNRLGFFLDMQQTNNKQLEQGIRYMFYDLYKNGTIFEVVFDMPKFLVETAHDGFFSQDLEEALKIKGTTAKKYIKIMIEVGLIKQEKGVGRKHFYRLIRENVMTRLGKDQATLIK